MNTITVTSPHTTGPLVLAAQNNLNGANVFKQDFLQGGVDGEFGVLTGQACSRAKSWVGYRTAFITPSYGDDLNDYLEGRKKPTALMRRRRAQRLRQEAAQTPMRARVLARAKTQLGVKESPAGSNQVLFSKWYGVRGPWCAMFVTWCHVMEGSKSFVQHSRYAYVPFMVADARAGRNGLSVTSRPLAGDVVAYDWDGGLADHTGLFERWSVVGDSFDAIEGNTAVGNDSNGGEVMRRRRRVSQAQAFIRVGR